jgi:predicted PolB exonuclease-like 3'-5' exonuclease
VERLFNGRSPNEQGSAQELASTGESRRNRFRSRDLSDHVIVWDLETVPDIAGYAAANGLTGKVDEEIREALGNKFPKHIYNSIVCIGALVAHKERDHWAVDAIGAPHVGERLEKELIASFVDRIAELTPQLVTFNGGRGRLQVNTAKSSAFSWYFGSLDLDQMLSDPGFLRNV